jgi:hypothetical protein
MNGILCKDIVNDNEELLRCITVHTDISDEVVHFLRKIENLSTLDELREYATDAREDSILHAHFLANANIEDCL